MSVMRINQFTAKPGSEQQLYGFLSSTRSVIMACPGCLSCRLLQGVEDPAQLAIVEEWESVEAHKAAAAAIPPEKFAVAMAMLATPPASAYYKA